MRARLIGLLVGLSLAAAPALACAYHQTSASNDSQQTAQTQTPSDSGTN